MEEIFNKIAARWFLSEPALFSLFCIQGFRANPDMDCPIRCVKDGIEYNPKRLKGLDPIDIEAMLFREMLRIFMKHPYERQPENCSNAAKLLGSDCSLYDSYKKDNLPFLGKPAFFKLENKEAFEWYSHKIEEMLEPGSGSGDDDSQEDSESGNPSQKESKEGGIPQKILEEASAMAAEWEEDEMKVAEINDLIEKTQNWGSMPGDLIQKIIASTKAKIDYKSIMEGFRGSILSSHRKLTRMRPNRRTDFEQMGSNRKFSTSLLVAVDVSGSVTDKTLADFYSVINRFFRYGIEKIDVVQFDCEVGEVMSLSKAAGEIAVFGRGGTDFQPVFDYVANQRQYDGLIILTDGYADQPKVADNMRTKVLWVCEDENSFERHKEWMSKIGRVCWMYL